MIINRKLHVYDFLLNQILFVTKLSGGVRSGCTVSPPQNLFFLDQDQMVVVQEGSRITIFSVSAQIEIYQRATVPRKNGDIVLKIEGPTEESNLIDMGFGYIGARPQIHQDESKKEDDSDSDNLLDNKKAFLYLDHDAPIEHVFFCRNSTMYGYLGILSANRVAVYYVQEGDGECDVDLQFDFDYRFRKSVRLMGRILCLDFEDECKNFVTGSNLGWVGIWDIVERKFRRAYQIVDPATKRAEPIDMIRDIAAESILVTYSYKTQHLLLIHDSSGKGYTIISPKARLLPHDSQTKGNVVSLKVESGLNHLLVTFINGSVTIWNLKDFKIEHEIQPPQRLSGQPFTGQVFIDEFCTYMAYLTENKRAVEFYSMHWDHKVLKIEKVVQPAPSSSKRKRKAIRLSKANHEQQQKKRPRGKEVPLRGSFEKMKSRLGLEVDEKINTASSVTCSTF